MCVYFFQVVLCGGSARIPRLQQMIRDVFPEVEQLNSAPPDEVIAVGAAIEAGLLVGRDSPSPEEESVTVDACAGDILVKVTHEHNQPQYLSPSDQRLDKALLYTRQEVDESGAEVFNVLLPSGTPLPARRNHTLTGQGQLSSLCLELYQRTADQPERLAKVHTHTHTHTWRTW